MAGTTHDTGAADTVRAAARGDVLPTNTARSAERNEVNDAIGAAVQLAANSMQDVLAHQDKDSVLDSIRALMDGLSPDEAGQLRSLILEGDPGAWQAGRNRHPDEALSSGWREGAYPYQNLMSRRNYEKQKYRLQVELLKLQAWVRETGQRVVIVFEGRDAAGKGGTIKRFMEHMNPRGARVVALENQRPVVLPALRAAPAVGRRDRAVRPLLVQPRRRRARDGLLLAAGVPGLPAAGA